ncbi:MAG: twin-arginine translocase subunit TatC [Candidatus Krumholzibacteriota bacterium]
MTDQREPELPFEPSDGESGGSVGGPKDQPDFGGLNDDPNDDPNKDPNEDPNDDPNDGATEDGNEESMGLLDHLGELRAVLLHSFIAALAATILCWFWSADLLDILIRPIREQGIYFTAPNEAFLTRLKLSAVVGLFVVAPFIFFKIYGFVLPGLYQRERRLVTPLLLATTALFYTGVAFAFLVVIPQVIAFLLSFGTDVMEPLIGVGPYFNFVSRLCLAFGLVFELPLLVLFLSVVGIVNPRMLLRAWRYAIIIIVAMSAMLTPPDVISQVMMAGPVMVLYLGSVLVSIAVTNRRNKNEDDDQD